MSQSGQPDQSGSESPQQALAAAQPGEDCPTAGGHDETSGGSCSQQSPAKNKQQVSLDCVGDSPEPSSSAQSPNSVTLNYSGLAAKTVANIRRLQENVQQAGSGGAAATNATGWMGNYQVPPPPCTDNLQQLSSPENRRVLASVSSSSTMAGSSPQAPVQTPQSPSDASPVQVLLPATSSATLSSSFNALVTIDPNWQSTKSTLRERNSVMCNNALMADIYFSVGAEIDPQAVKRFPAHKYVLATGSTVFYAMFYGGFTEDKERVVEVPDVEPIAFLTMLRYLYCDEIALDADNVLATLYCAKKYLVMHLAAECVRFLENSLTAQNACALLSQARLFAESSLTQRCWEVIESQAELALLSEGFCDIDLDTLRAILQRETLNCKETVIFKAATNWAAAECVRRELPVNSETKRQCLGSAISLIRFPAMPVQDFADEVVGSEMLTLQETTDIFMHFTATPRNRPEVVYPSAPRQGLPLRTCHRFQSSAYRSNQWRYRGRCDSIQFCVDKRIFVVGFGLYGSSNGASDYEAKIELKQRDGNVIGTACKSFYSDGSSSTFKVFFDQPVQIEADQYYTASAILDGAELSYFGQEGLVEVSASGVTFQFQSSLDSTNGTGVQGGQIPELLFYGPGGITLLAETKEMATLSPLEEKTKARGCNVKEQPSCR